MNSGSWQTSPLFSGLAPASTYSFTQRFAETLTHSASPESTAATFKTDEEVGIMEITNHELRIYPNPTTGELRIACRDVLQCVFTNVEVFDVYGRMQKSRKAEKQNGEWGLDISNLSAGIYFVKIETESGVVTKKVVKL